MRMLARELSVSVSTLYWHVRDKRELLKLMIDDSLSTLRIPDTGDWKERLGEFLRQGRRVLRARPAKSLASSAKRTARRRGRGRVLHGRCVLFGFVALETLSPDTPGFATEPVSSDDAVPVPHLARYRPAADLKGMERRFERGVARIVSSLAQPGSAVSGGLATHKQRGSRPRRPATTSVRRPR